MSYAGVSSAYAMAQAPLSGRYSPLSATSQSLERQWLSFPEACQRLGLSQRTMRRRLQQPHWIEGRHYRWVVRHTRAVLQIHIGRAFQLLENQGW